MALPNFAILTGGRSVKMTCLATITQGNPVKLGTNGVDAAGDGATMFGIALESGATGDQISVWRGPGQFTAKAASGVNFAMGDQVYLAASNEVDAGSATNKSIGVVVDNDPATAGTVTIDFDPWGTFAHA